jgi:hypothetical protein
MLGPDGAASAMIRSIVVRLMPVIWLTRYLLTPAATARRTRLSRSRVTVTHSMSICSAPSCIMFNTVHVSCWTSIEVGEMVNWYYSTPAYEQLRIGAQLLPQTLKQAGAVEFE